MKRVWFITGCSSGFGRLLAERAYAMGESVIATARVTQSLRDIGRGDEKRVLRLPVDVRDPEQIRNAVAQAIERFGQIDVLVNNAGYGYFATQEEGELDQIREMYETNVFGLIAMTQGVLPHMRERKAGTIVNLSSIAGRMTTPRGGFYQSSKWAVEALSESLHLETAGFGLRVIVIEPGSYETDFSSRSARSAEAEHDPSSPYAQLRKPWMETGRRHIFNGRGDAAEVIDGIIEAIESSLQFIRLPIGKDATRLIAKRRELGDARFVDWLRKTYEEN